VKLGLALSSWKASSGLTLPVGLVQLAERLGYDSVWTAEAYGVDALTPLAYLAAVTTRIRLGTSVVQIGARTPTATAMAFATLDELAGRGRVIAGLGVSGPQVIEGWYGQPWSRPLARTRDFVAVMRRALARQGPLVYSGPTLSVPYRGPDGTGLGKPLRSILHANPCIPIWLGAGGPSNVALAAEIADGWLSMGMNPWNIDGFRPAIEEGAARAGRRLADLDVHAAVWVSVTDDVGAAIGELKRQVALDVGGMGSSARNFHTAAMARRGYAEEAYRIQDLFLAGRRDEAVEAVPADYCDDLGLFGSEQRIRRRLEPWTRCGITVLAVRSEQPEAVAVMARVAS
jgi:F420-dependent oxidoreductase-like protein